MTQTPNATNSRRPCLAYRLLTVFFVAVTFAQVALDAVFSFSHIGGDFSVRYNEVECLKTGVDPFDVWSGRVRHDPYYSFHGHPEPGQSKKVHAYPPWEYTFFLPLSFFPKTVASRLYQLIQWTSFLGIIICLVKIGRHVRNRKFDGLFVAACGLFLGSSLQCAFWFQQYGITNMALLYAMFHALDRKRPIVAGVCWALIMAKPQIGALLFIPLAMGHKWKTIVTAGVICCLASIPSALLCHASPLDMILNLLSSGGTVLSGTSIIPKPIFAAMASGLHPVVPALLSAFVGMGLCVWFSWRLKFSSCWMVRMLPAVVCATGWTYLQLHDKTLLMFPQIMLAVCILHEKTIWRRWLMAMLVLINSLSLGAYIHAGGTNWIHDHVWHLPDGLPSKWLYGIYLVGSFVQFVGLCIFLFWLSNDRNEHFHRIPLSERKGNL